MSGQNEFSFDFGLPPGTREVRINPPGDNGLYLKKLRITLGAEDRRESLPLDRLLVASQGAVQVADTDVILHAKDPYFRLQMPPVTSMSNVHCALRGRAYPDFSNWAIMHTAYFLAQADLYLWKEALSDSQRRRFEQISQVVEIKKKLLEEANLTLYWKADGQDFADERSIEIAFVQTLAASGNANCDLMIPLDADVSQLKLALPGINGVAYSFEILEVMGPGLAPEAIAMKSE